MRVINKYVSTRKSFSCKMWLNKQYLICSSYPFAWAIFPFRENLSRKNCLCKPSFITYTVLFWESSQVHLLSNKHMHGVFTCRGGSRSAFYDLFKSKWKYKLVDKQTNKLTNKLLLLLQSYNYNYNERRDRSKTYDDYNNHRSMYNSPKSRSHSQSNFYRSPR